MGDLKGRKKMRVLCFPGDKEWDFDFFSGYKNVSEIVGIEVERDVSRQLQKRKGKKFKVVNRLASDHLMGESRPYDLIYLDYCSNMGLVLDFDTKIILRRKLVKPGGFLIMNIFGARSGHGTECPCRLAYGNFCEALGVEAEGKMQYQRLARLAWNSIVGVSHIVPVSPKGHYVKTSVPVWAGYQSKKGGPMYTATAKVISYPRSRQASLIKKHKRQWLMTGSHRACKWYQ